MQASIYRSSIYTHYSYYISYKSTCATMLDNTSILVQKSQHKEIESLINLQPYLQIKSCRVATDYQSACQHAATEEDINTYYQDTYQRNQSQIDMICWKSHGKAFSALPGQKLKTTLQFVHQWLPLNGASSQQKRQPPSSVHSVPVAMKAINIKFHVSIPQAFNLRRKQYNTYNQN
jgi:hypothetical protein